jgi:hypothetical protein
MSASYFKIHLEIDNRERIKTKLDDKRMIFEDGFVCLFMVFYATFNNISVSFMGGGNWSIRSKPPTTLTDFIT